MHRNELLQTRPPTQTKVSVSMQVAIFHSMKGIVEDNLSIEWHEHVYAFWRDPISFSGFRFFLRPRPFRQSHCRWAHSNANESEGDVLSATRAFEIARVIVRNAYSRNRKHDASAATWQTGWKMALCLANAGANKTSIKDGKTRRKNPIKARIRLITGLCRNAEIRAGGAFVSGPPGPIEHVRVRD